MKYLYRTYQLLICLPLFLLSTMLTATVTALGCALGAVNFFGYHPGRLWSKLTIRSLLLPIRVEGREHLRDGQSYVFVANHQGAFDIFIIYGYLGRNFKWLMKQALRKVPFVGIACEYARHIFVDKSSPGKVKQTYERARTILHVALSAWRLHAGRRVAVAHSTADNQRLVQGAAATARRTLHNVASADADHPRAHNADRAGRRERAADNEDELRGYRKVAEGISMTKVADRQRQSA